MDINPITNVEIFKKSLWVTEYAFRMKKWSDGKKVPPLRIDAEPHRRCNLKCIMCARRASPIDLTEESKRIELSEGRWIEIARESGEMGVKAWNISGIGEPMCKPQLIINLMKTIKAYDMFGELTTNGTLWNQKLIEKTVNIGWDSICISIDAPDAETHDFLRGVRGTFKIACKTTKLFRKVRDKINSSVPLLTINMVLNKLNYNKITDMVKLTNDLGADALFVEPMIVYSKEAEKIKLGDKEIPELPDEIKEAEELGREMGIFTTITCMTPERKFQGSLVEKAGSSIKDVLIQDAKFHHEEVLSIPCYYPWFFLMIRADGSAIHCGEWEGQMGNVKNQSLHDIWFGKEAEKIRDFVMVCKLPDSCNRCRPNVIEDMRQMRRAIENYSRIENLQEKIIELLKENREIKKMLYELKRKKSLDIRDLTKIEELKNHEKELLKLKSSIGYKIWKKISKTEAGNFLKTKLRRFVR
jgi:MoaA/NifB/PqqE/SkfB family radical SAM enzyme